MADDSRLRRFAVLIDADNTSPRIVAGLFEEIAKFGEASVRRIYGDFSSPRMRSWAEILQKYARQPCGSSTNTTRITPPAGRHVARNVLYRLTSVPSYSLKTPCDQPRF